MYKAKSRLEQKKRKPKFKIKKHLVHYLKHIPTLLISIPFFLVCYFILNKVEPNRIDNFLLIKTYLPLQIPLFTANFFFFSFITLKTRRGFSIASIISIFLFLKLQNVIINWLVVVTILISFVIIELILMSFEKLKQKENKKNNEKISKKTKQRSRKKAH